MVSHVLFYDQPDQRNQQRTQGQGGPHCDISMGISHPKALSAIAAAHGAEEQHGHGPFSGPSTRAMRFFASALNAIRIHNI